MIKYFIDDIQVNTDLCGSTKHQRVTVGWFDKISGQYYNLDEVKRSFDAGETRNVYQRSDGSLYMNEVWLDARTCFRVVCSIPFGVHGDHYNLLEYAKKIGLVSAKPRPVQMFSGVKHMKFNDNGTCTIEYHISPEIGKEVLYSSYLYKICVGAINRLRNKSYRYYNGTDPEGQIQYPFSCKDVSFDESSLVLTIEDIPEKCMAKDDLTHTLRLLDLELYVADSTKFNFHDILSASQNYARDYGQFHWINEEQSKSLESSNVYWYDKAPNN